MGRKVRRIIVFISLVSICFVAQSQTETEPAKLDIITKKLERVNSGLQTKIQKLQKKLEKKLRKKFPGLNKVQLDSLVQAKNNLNLLDSVQNEPSKYCTGCPDINTIKKQLQEKIKLTPPNLDIAKDLNISIKELNKLEDLMQKLPKIDQLPLFDLEGLKSSGMEKVPFSAGDFKGLQSKAGGLNGLLDEYKKEFSGWEDKLLAKVTSMEEVKLLQEQRKKMESFKPLPESYRENIDQFQSNDFVKQRLQAKAEEFEKISKETLQEKLDEALDEVSKAKKKFPSLESLKEAPKRPENPLKEEKFINRLRIGGNLQVNRQSPSSIDLSFKLGYLIKPKVQIGIGSAYRFSTEDGFSNLDLNGEVFTTKLFFDHFVYKSFYLQAVMEWNRVTQKDLNDINLGTEWVQSGLIGMGREFSLTKKLKGSFSILYNVLHDEKSPYKRPVVFRIGFRL